MVDINLRHRQTQFSLRHDTMVKEERTMAMTAAGGADRFGMGGDG